MDDYKIISTLNEEHKVYLVQSEFTKQVYVQKILDVYNIHVYEHLYQNPIAGIPRIIDFYEQDNTLVVIEEYISGTSLQEKIDHSDLFISDIQDYMLMLCNILESLHAMKPPIIHRDIKPSNIIITSYNYAVLLDFNAAKQFSSEAPSDTVLLGTPGYAAPEQYGFGSSSPLTDIYSLGIVLKEMMESLSSANSSFINVYQLIINRCTQLSPAARYQSIAALKKAILEMTDKKPVLPYTEHKRSIMSSKLSEKALSVDKSRFLPPGFRSMTPWKMVLSSMVYLFMIFICSSVEVENTYGALLWLNRIFMFLVFMFPVFCGFNYLNIQNIFPLCKSKQPIIHYLGIVLLDIAGMFLLMILLFIIESICFPG